LMLQYFSYFEVLVPTDNATDPIYIGGFHCLGLP